MDEPKLKRKENGHMKNAFEIWVEKVIEAELGDISTLTKEIREHIRTTYQVFARAYLEWLRMEKDQPQGWIPEEIEFKSSLVNAMSHFYSDHQPLVSKLNMLRTQVRRLQSLDCRKNLAAFEVCVNHILQGEEKQSTFDRIYSELKEEDASR